MSRSERLVRGRGRGPGSVVMQPAIWMRDEGRQVQISFVRTTPGELKYLSFDDAIGIVL